MKTWIRVIIILISELVIALLIHLFRSTVWTLITVSDALFIVGTVACLSSVVMFSGAYQVFSGFNYVVRTFFSSGYKEQYPHYHDYVEAKEIKKASPIWLEMLIVSTLLIVTSLILGSIS